MSSPTLALVELLLKGTAVLLAGYGGAALLRRSSAAHRSLAWLGVFATLLVLPLALLVRPVWSLPVHSVIAPAEFQTAAGPVAQGQPAQVSPAVQAPPGVGSWLLAGYIAGAAGVLVYRLLGAVQLWSLRRSSTSDAASQALIDRWRADMGLAQRVAVVANPRVRVPMTWGTWRPVILLPAALPQGAGAEAAAHGTSGGRCWGRETPPRGPSTLEAGPDEEGSTGRGRPCSLAGLGVQGAEWEAALRHEFAHICHHDAARRWLGTIVAALWWPHPLVWAALRAWKMEQERACDDVVLNAGAEAASYAQQLAQAACQLRLPHWQSAAALVMAMPAGLETRLRAVANPQLDRSPARVAAQARMVALAVLASLGGVAFQAQPVIAAPEGSAPDPALAALMKKAEAAIIPKLEFRDTNAEDAVREIALKSGVAVTYLGPKNGGAPITLSLTNVPASEALRYVAGLANLVLTFTKDGASLIAHDPAELFTVTTTSAPDPAAAALMKKAAETIIPKLEFRELSIEDAAREITAKSGIAVAFRAPKNNEARVTMNLTNVPASEALHYLANLSNLTVAYHKDGVSFERNTSPGPAIPLLEPPAVPAVDLITRSWRVPPGFIQPTPGGEKALAARDALVARGVVFPPGGSAVYLPEKSQLIVRNTQANLDLVDAMVELSTKKAPPKK